MVALSSLDVLVVEDNEHVRKSLSLLLQKSGYEVQSVAGARQALVELKKKYFDLVVTDYKMKPMDGMELLIEIKKQWPATEVIMITAFGTISKGVQAIKMGAFDYITKPYDNKELLDLIQRLVENRAQAKNKKKLEEEIRERSEFDSIVGQSEPMLELMTLVSRIAETDSTVLIYGESGTGKELIAQAIHNRSVRRDNPFVAINCGAIPESLQESELFGHVKGAFTGADNTQKGLFEVGDTGTVFLDEIAETAPSTQVKLLRFLENNEIRKVGENITRKVDVRLIAATNKNLEDEVKRGRLREDLFYRINVVPISTPPLRERKDDIPLLVEHFIRKHGVNGLQAQKVSKRAMSMLINYGWPGNVRELENVIQRAIAFAETDEITPDLLPKEVRYGAANRRFTAQASKLSDIEKEVILQTLRRMNGNKRRTAEELGISKTTLWRKLKEIEMPKDFVREFSP